MNEARCPRCAAALRGAVRFCTSCGGPLDDAAAPQPTPAPGAPAERPVDPRLVHCRACEASNAVSRARCGRCGADLATGAPPSDPDAPAGEPAPDPAAAETADFSTLFATGIALAALALLAVLGIVLASRGVGFFTTPDEAPSTDAVPAQLAGAEASSALPPFGDLTFGPDNLLDGDATTAWIADASGDAVGEWVAIDLAGEAAVTRIVLWNGYQRGEVFGAYARVTGLRLTLGEEVLSADVLDRDGPQAIDLPTPVLTDRVRLEITEVGAGSRYRDPALSRVDILVRPEGSG